MLENNIDKELLEKDIAYFLDELGIKAKIKGYQLIRKIMVMKLLDKLQGEEERQVRTLIRIIQADEEEYRNIDVDNAIKYAVKSIWEKDEIKSLFNNQQPRNGNDNK